MKEFSHEEKKKAEGWFADRGVDVRVDPKTLKDPNPLFVELPSVPKPAFGPSSEELWVPSLEVVAPEVERVYECKLTITSLFFYTWFWAEFYDTRSKKHYQFEGGSGGIGVGSADGWGLIYFADPKKLLAAEAFGLAYGGAYAGLAQVTWGLTGNASAELLGTGVGVFGGSGEWKEIVK